MRLTSVELFELQLPLVHFFETSFGRTTERRVIVLCARSHDGALGWGECTAGEGPFYCEEWTESAWHALRTWIIPAVLGQELAAAADVAALLAPMRGNRMAKAALETACWDLEARSLDQPLWRLLGGTQTEIACGVSIGIQDGVDALLDKIATEVDAGYQRIKIKIKPGWDVNVFERVRQRFPDIALMGDANSAYTLADLPTLLQMDQFNLLMLEQPLAHDDIVEHALLQQKLQTAVCLDESIRHARDAAHALEIGACRVINIKLGRVGGYNEAKLTEAVARNHGIPVWCGGMLETGIGRAHNIALSTLPGFVLPGDVSASKRYWAEDIIEPEVIVSARGTIAVPTGPGIGFEVRRDRIEAHALRYERFDFA